MECGRMRERFLSAETCRRKESNAGASHWMREGWQLCYCTIHILHISNMLLLVILYVLSSSLCGSCCVYFAICFILIFIFILFVFILPHSYDFSGVQNFVHFSRKTVNAQSCPKISTEYLNIESESPFYSYVHTNAY